MCVCISIYSEILPQNVIIVINFLSTSPISKLLKLKIGAHAYNTST